MCEVTFYWKKVENVNPARCTRCGKFAQTTWNLFEKPLVFTQALCEPCVEVVTEAS